MSGEKTPTILVLILRTRSFDWFVAAIEPNGHPQPLLRSEPGDLRNYVGMPPDEQLSFLRHRLSGALQQGYDRLWARDWKASHVVMLADDHLPEAAADLTQRLAEHFHVWMTRPPVTWFRAQQELAADPLPPLERLAGALDDEQAVAWEAALPGLVEAMAQPHGWEPASKPKL